MVIILATMCVCVRTGKKKGIAKIPYKSKMSHMLVKYAMMMSSGRTVIKGSENNQEIPLNRQNGGDFFSRCVSMCGFFSSRCEKLSL